jgi:aldose 1-epimerase
VRCGCRLPPVQAQPHSRPCARAADTTLTAAHPADVTLGYDTAEEYAKCSTYFGSVVGRCANRIAQGRFTLDGTAYQLACNNGPNALHGGPTGFHTREWSVESLLGEDGQALAADASSPSGVVLAYTSAAGEEHYPGELRARVTYLLRRDDGSGLGAAGGAPALLTRLQAECDAATIVNLAQHAYWNLGGHGSGSVLPSHSLRLAAERYTPVDDTQIPTGELAAVAGTPFDFTAEKLLATDAGGVPGGRAYDHNFVLGGANALRPSAQAPSPPELAAVVCHAGSGRRMELFSDAPGVQLYTGGFLAGEKGKGGAVYPQHGGLCLETQDFPDAVNQAKHGFPSPILRPGQQYSQTMVSLFTTFP